MSDPLGKVTPGLTNTTKFDKYGVSLASTFISKLIQNFRSLSPCNIYMNIPHEYLTWLNWSNKILTSFVWTIRYSELILTSGYPCFCFSATFNINAVLTLRLSGFNPSSVSYPCMPINEFFHSLEILASLLFLFIENLFFCRRCYPMKFKPISHCTA